MQEGFDVCLQPGDVPGDAGGILEAVEILPIRRVVVASRDYAARHDLPSTPEELTQHRIALNNHVSPDCRLSFIQNGDAVSVPIDPIILTNTIWLLRAAVLRGECLAMMPVYFIEDELNVGPRWCPSCRRYPCRASRCWPTTASPSLCP